MAKGIRNYHYRGSMPRWNAAKGVTQNVAAYSANEGDALKTMGECRYEAQEDNVFPIFSNVRKAVGA